MLIPPGTCCFDSQPNKGLELFIKAEPEIVSRCLACSKYFSQSAEVLGSIEEGSQPASMPMTCPACKQKNLYTFAKTSDYYAQHPVKPYFQNGDYQALLNGVKQEPFDKARQLILADWIEEHTEDSYRAEFIRHRVDNVDKESIPVCFTGPNSESSDGYMQPFDEVFQFSHTIKRRTSMVYRSGFAFSITITNNQYFKYHRRLGELGLLSIFFSDFKFTYLPRRHTPFICRVISVANPDEYRQAHLRLPFYLHPEIFKQLVETLKGSFVAYRLNESEHDYGVDFVSIDFQDVQIGLASIGCAIQQATKHLGTK